MKNSREGIFHRIPGKYLTMIRAIPAWLRCVFSRANRPAACSVSGSMRGSDACGRPFWPVRPDSRRKVAFDVCENSPESAVSTGCVVPRRERSFAKPPGQVWPRRRQVLQAQEKTGRKPCVGRWKTRPGSLSPGAGATFGETLRSPPVVASPAVMRLFKPKDVDGLSRVAGPAPCARRASPCGP